MLWAPPLVQTPRVCAGCYTGSIGGGGHPGHPGGNVNVQSITQSLLSFETAVVLGTSLTLLPGSEVAAAFRERVLQVLRVLHQPSGTDQRSLSPRTTTSAAEGARCQVTFIRRRSSRRVMNEEAVLASARAWAEQHQGTVEVAELESMSFDAQVELMARTTLLVAVHGAGLANALFMPAGSAVIELFPARFVYPLYEKIAAASGHLHFRYLARTSETDYAAALSAVAFEGWSTRRCFASPECIRITKEADLRVNEVRLVALLDDAWGVIAP